jgi:hypothetical protein
MNALISVSDETGILRLRALDALGIRLRLLAAHKIAIDAG